MDELRAFFVGGIRKLQERSNEVMNVEGDCVERFTKFWENLSRVYKLYPFVLSLIE